MWADRVGEKEIEIAFTHIHTEACKETETYILMTDRQGDGAATNKTLDVQKSLQNQVLWRDSRPTALLCLHSFLIWFVFC